MGWTGELVGWMDWGNWLGGIRSGLFEWGGEPIEWGEVDWGPWGKKEAQIEIQAVAKIQYPIKSHSIYCKLNSTSF